MNRLTHARLHNLLFYNLYTGKFKWMKSGTGRKLNGEAGWIHKKGYRRIEIDGRDYLASRLAYFYVTGSWPKGDMHHKNEIHDDDRWSNLESVSKIVHARKHNNQWNNTSGVTGVSKHGKGWRVRINGGGTRKRLGTYKTFDEAVKERYKAEQVYSFPKNTSTAYKYLKARNLLTEVA